MVINKRLLLVLGMVLSFAGLKAEGEVSFSMEGFSIKPGETVEVSLDMSNSAVVQIFNGSILMSEGLSFVSEYDEEEELDMYVFRTDRLHNKHEIGFNLKSANSLTFLVHSGTTRRDIAVGEGAVLKFKVKADEYMALGEAQIKVSKLSATNSDNVELCDVTEFTTQVEVYKPVITDEQGNSYVDNGDGSIALTEAAVGDDGVVSIPGTVSSDEKSFSVTGIADGAFANVDKSGIAAIDLSETGVTNVVVNRTEGLFSGVAEGTVIFLPAGSGNQAAEGEKNVVIGGVCDEFALQEDVAFKTTKAFNVRHATFDRDFTLGVSATVYLPFSIPASLASSLGSFHTFKGITVDGTAEFNAAETGDIEGLTPYIFIPSTTSIDITDAGGGIQVKVSDSTAGTNGTLVGTTEAITWTSPDGIYGFAGEAKGDVSVGEFVKAASGASVAPYRAYLVITEAAARHRYQAVVSGGGDSTGIRDATDGVTDGNQQWYNLNGQGIGASPKQKGVYIRNGKKAIIK